MGFLVGDGPMLDASRNNQEFSFFEPEISVAEFHAKPPLHHQEKLVLMVVVMPDKGPAKLDELDLLIVQLADDLWAPLLLEQIELVPKINFFHVDMSRYSGSLGHLAYRMVGGDGIQRGWELKLPARKTRF